MSDSVVRPFILTKGRTRAAEGIVMESLVSRREPPGTSPRLDSVQQQIVALLDSMMSVAEISALLALPLGVVLVVVSDLAELEVVEVHKTAALDDIHLVRRLIDGVRAL